MSLYHEAAQILTSSPSQGGSLKSRIFNSKEKKNFKSPPSQLYALVLETARWSSVLKEVVEKAELLRHERKLTPALALLLTHDLLLAKGGIALPQTHGLRTAVERHKGRLASELTLARLRRKAGSLHDLREQVVRESSSPGEQSHPRWVRVNALKSTLEDELDSTFAGYTRARDIAEVVQDTKAQTRRILIDPHVPNLLAITPGVDLSKTEAYAKGRIILQDKASCFPAYLLDPRVEDGDVVDACAAPGNKTTHLAAIIHEHKPEFKTRPQSIFAFEKDAHRAKTLEKMVNIAGTKSVTHIGFGQDFLEVDPASDKYSDVGALLLDPSCSGSGIVGRDAMPQVHLPDQSMSNGKAKGKKLAGGNNVSHSLKRKRDDATASPQVLIDDDGNETVAKSERDLEARLQALSSFQLALLQHAFRFPAARKITYSTCSIHAQENEHVVTRALQSQAARERGWRILRRPEQVTGMREWPVRGLKEACGGDEEMAEGCIRSHQEDGLGVMGFFVAGFVRDAGASAKGEDEEGPYVRSDEGIILRDVTGMPMLKETGQVVELVPRDEDGEAGLHIDPNAAKSPAGEDEWNGFED